MMRRARQVSAALLTGWMVAVHASEPVTLRDFDAKSLAAIRAANQGRPFVLALWSIHCEACLREMPHWAQLRRRYPGVRIVLVATDPRQERPQLRKFLDGHTLDGVQTWAFVDDFEERVRFAIDRSWRGELPRTYLFDASHRAQPRSGPADPKWIEPWLARQSTARRAGKPTPDQVNGHALPARSQAAVRSP